MAVLEICGPCSHERAECSLSCGVDAERGGTLNACYGAVENDGPTILQERQSFLHREQSSLHIDVEQLVEMFFGDGAEWNKFTNTSVGENNVDSTLRLGNGLVETIKVIQVGNI